MNKTFSDFASVRSRTNFGKSAGEALVFCPVCAGDAHFLMRRPSDVSCSDRFVEVPRLGWGEDIDYWQCDGCAHIFSRDFDDWDNDMFRRRIYNKDYALFDPGYLGTRPGLIADAVLDLMKPPLSLLDYGAGEGVLSKRLRAAGFDVTNYEPMGGNTVLQPASADLVLCIEVVEHAPFPGRTFEELHRALRPGGALIISTLLANEALEHSAWWLGPRNGHVCAFSPQSLDALAPDILSVTPGVHLYGGEALPRDRLLELCKRIDKALLCER